MDLAKINLLKNIIPESYAKKAVDALNTHNRIIQDLLFHKKIPKDGWNDKLIEDLLYEIIYEKKTILNGNSEFGCGIVAKRNYNFIQGSSLSALKAYIIDAEANRSIKIHELANSFMAELIKMMGVHQKINCGVIPVATGMSLIFAMLTFRFFKPKAKYVIWSRIDQKSCFKSIVSAGFIPVIVNTKRENEEYVSDVNGIENKILEIGAENVNCVMSTTSCFAPRACDNIEAIAAICDKNNVHHLINNAYGLSKKYIMKRIHRASLKGRVDIFVQSTDKNLCLPVGGAIVASFSPEIYSRFIEICSENMSINVAIDIVATILGMGKKKYIQMLKDCDLMYKYLKDEMSQLCKKYGEKIIENPGNPISIALTLNNVPKHFLTHLGSMLFTRNVSGARVVTTEEVKVVCGFQFNHWGAHSDDCSIPYLTAAASVGIVKTDIDIFIDKLDKIFSSLI